MSKYNSFPTNNKPKPLTIKSLDASLEAMKKERNKPTYTNLPDDLVDECLRRDIVPQFVMVSAKSAGKIKKHLKAQQVKGKSHAN